MRTEEDEAFDSLAQKQGDWGGGFPAKRAMAMDKLQEPDEALTLEALKYAASRGYGHIVQENSAPFTIKAALTQPAQEPAETLENLEQEIYENTREFVSHNVMEWMLKRYYTAPPQRPWVGLTDEEIGKQTILAGFNPEWKIEIGMVFSIVRNLEAKLRSKNT
jgi:hypothetical protein